MKYRFLGREIPVCDDKLVLDNERFDRLICASVSSIDPENWEERIQCFKTLPSFARVERKVRKHVWK